MKKLFTLILLFCSVASLYAQEPVFLQKAYEFLIKRDDVDTTRIYQPSKACLSLGLLTTGQKAGFDVDVDFKVKFDDASSLDGISKYSLSENLCKKIDGLELTSEYTVQLFGFPEWQTLSGKYDKYLGKYQCQFFTSFYSNALSSRTQQFNGRFRRWFNQDQYNSFPKYGELGYDIGAYFIKGIHDFGSSFYENIHNFSYVSMEFPMMFEKKNAWSGYQNRSMMIVTHRTDGSVFVR